MARQHNGEGSWGTKTIKGVTYKYFRNTEGKYFYGKTNSEINTKRKKWEKTYEQSFDYFYFLYNQVFRYQSMRV